MYRQGTGKFLVTSVYEVLFGTIFGVKNMSEQGLSTTQYSVGSSQHVRKDYVELKSMLRGNLLIHLGMN
jgi:hypothetical protein